MRRDRDDVEYYSNRFEMKKNTIRTALVKRAWDYLFLVSCV